MKKLRLICVLLLLLACQAEGLAAPAPFARREKASKDNPAYTGYWYGHWKHRDWPCCRVHFMPDGKYEARYDDGEIFMGGTIFVGKWWLMTDEDGHLRVAIEESPLLEPGKKEKWAFLPDIFERLG